MLLLFWNAWVAGSTRRNAITEILSCLPAGRAFCLIKTSECKTHAFSSLGHCSTHWTQWQKTVLNFTLFSPSGLTRACLPTTCDPPQLLKEQNLRWEGCPSPQHVFSGVSMGILRYLSWEHHRKGFAEGYSLGEQEVRSLVTHCSLGAKSQPHQDVKPSVFYPQASISPSAWDSQLIWDLLVDAAMQAFVWCKQVPVRSSHTDLGQI